LLPIGYRSGHRDDGLEVKSSDLLDDGLSAFGAFIMVVKPLLAWEAKVPGDLAQFLPRAPSGAQRGEGWRQRRPPKRAKSRSKDHSSAPCSMVTAAR